MEKDAKKIKKEGSKSSSGKQLAAIRLRGLNSINSRIEYTLQLLRLYKNNYCCVLQNNEIHSGMLRKVKDYITWGEIDDETFKMLVEKRGEDFKGKETDSKKMKKYFRLNPPRKGFEKKGIKHTFREGGALGYRGAAINELIKRMI